MRDRTDVRISSIKINSEAEEGEERYKTFLCTVEALRVETPFMRCNSCESGEGTFTRPSVTLIAEGNLRERTQSCQADRVVLPQAFRRCVYAYR